MSDLFPEEFFPIAAGLMGELITVRCVEKVRQIRMFTTICLPALCERNGNATACIVAVEKEICECRANLLYCCRCCRRLTSVKHIIRAARGQGAL